MPMSKTLRKSTSGENNQDFWIMEQFFGGFLSGIWATLLEMDSLGLENHPEQVSGRVVDFRHDFEDFGLFGLFKFPNSEALGFQSLLPDGRLARTWAQ